MPEDRTRVDARVALGASFLLFLGLWWPGSPPAPGGFPWPDGIDKVAHAGIFAIVSWLWHRAFRHGRAPVRATFLAALAAALLTEIGQTWVPRRSPDPFDVVADLAGLGLFLLCLAISSRRSKSNPAAPERAHESQ